MLHHCVAIEHSSNYILIGPPKLIDEATEALLKAVEVSVIIRDDGNINLSSDGVVPFAWIRCKGTVRMFRPN